MPQSEQFKALILGSGFGGKLLAWHLAQSGRRTAVVERRWIGGSCPNIACLPSNTLAGWARHYLNASIDSWLAFYNVGAARSLVGVPW
jgi:pyruvate/2-oxoglutarate dehydrogenase complex dihydrolipoamide dehydrogenase (E3) component